MLPILNRIGFYTLSEERLAQAAPGSPLWRAELILTARCNFRCAYCRFRGEEMDEAAASYALDCLLAERLRHVRFSGGEPTMWPALLSLVQSCRGRGVHRIAVSTNGSAPQRVYRALIDAGVDDFSISLDGCCAADVAVMADCSKGVGQRVLDNIRYCASRVYTTVGIVLTEANRPHLAAILATAADLGVHDVRVIPAAQDGSANPPYGLLRSDMVNRWPIFAYRAARADRGESVRGLPYGDAAAPRCGLVADDVLVAGVHHYPCVIYFREGGPPIGRLGPRMREERAAWAVSHDVLRDPICRANCLDCLVEYNWRLAHRPHMDEEFEQ